MMAGFKQQAQEIKLSRFEAVELYRPNGYSCLLLNNLRREAKDRRQKTKERVRRYKIERYSNMGTVVPIVLFSVQLSLSSRM